MPVRGSSSLAEYRRALVMHSGLTAYQQLCFVWLLKCLKIGVAGISGELSEGCGHLAYLHFLPLIKTHLFLVLFFVHWFVTLCEIHGLLI